MNRSLLIVSFVTMHEVEMMGYRPATPTLNILEMSLDKVFAKLLSSTVNSTVPSTPFIAHISYLIIHEKHIRQLAHFRLIYC